MNINYLIIYMIYRDNTISLFKRELFDIVMTSRFRSSQAGVRLPLEDFLRASGGRSEAREFLEQQCAHAQIFADQIVTTDVYQKVYSLVDALQYISSSFPSPLCNIILVPMIKVVLCKTLI
jgi:hypothetical protein